MVSRLWVVLLALAGCAASPLSRPGAYQASDADVSITRIAHGSVIVALGRTPLLVDPWFHPRLLFHRTEPLGLLPDALPPLHGILITRAGSHFLDRIALHALAAQGSQIIAPAEIGADLRALGFADVLALPSGAGGAIGDVTVTATPDGGYLLAHGRQRVYIATDALDDDAVTTVRESLGPVTVALLPIGGPRLLGFRRGLDPERAAVLAGQIQADRTIPFRYGLGGGTPLWWYTKDPVDRFVRATRATLPANRVVVLAPGEGWHYSQ